MGTLHPFLKNYCATVTKKYWALKKKKTIQIRQFWCCLVFCDYVILAGHNLNISKTIFAKLIFHLCLSDKLPGVLLFFFYFTSKQFLLFLAYFCFEVIILMLFLLNILHPFFFIYLFNERYEIVQNTAYIKQYFCYDLGYHLFINQSLVSLCQP